VFSFGNAGFHGSMGGKPLNARSCRWHRPSDGAGYWEVASDGGIFNVVTPPSTASMGGAALNRPIDGHDGDQRRRGYWEAASDGGIFSFGDAHTR